MIRVVWPSPSQNTLLDLSLVPTIFAHIIRYWVGKGDWQGLINALQFNEYGHAILIYLVILKLSYYFLILSPFIAFNEKHLIHSYRPVTFNQPACRRL